MAKKMAMASSLKFLAQHKSRAADLRDQMQQQALVQSGVDAPKIATENPSYKNTKNQDKWQEYSG